MTYRVLSILIFLIFTGILVPQTNSFLSKLKFKHVPEYVNPGYKRHNWRHWIDADRDCQDTRQEVLIRDSLKPVTFKTAKKCRVASGLWRCSYTHKLFRNPRKLDIDHVVPLKEAFISGGYFWNKDKKKKFANDLKNSQHLLAVEAKANRRKGARDPANWLPVTNQCKYIKSWIMIKEYYKLSMNEQEINTIKKSFKKNCL